MRQLIVLVGLLVCGCTSLDQLGQAAQQPGSVECKGRVALTAVGNAGMIGGTGSITADCGDEGAYLRWGPAVAAPQ